MAIVPKTLEEWRAIAVSNNVIGSREAYENYLKTRKFGKPYVMRGAIEIKPGLPESPGVSDSERKKVVPLFQVKVFFPDGMKSGTYDLRLMGNAPPPVTDERALEQILLAHRRVEESIVGGNYKSYAFVVNYLDIPGVVEAVVFNQKVKCIKTA